MSNTAVLGSARELGDAVSATLKRAGATRAMPAGAARRGVEMVSEVVVVACGLAPRAAADAVRDALPGLGRLKVSRGEITGGYDGGAKLRINVVTEGDWVRVLLEETGDAAHVAWLKSAARRAGTSLEIAARVAADERAVYAALGLAPVPPELREGAAPVVPLDLLEEGGVRGVFHVHTDWSDGTASLVDMAAAARDAGFSYVGISDHSRAAVYARGLDAARLDEQAATLDVARREVPDVTILHGIEVDILDDGRLDLDDATLAKLDFVIASVHTRMNLGEAEMTARIVRAVSHPLVTMLGHPTGRLLAAKSGYRFDVARVATAAAANGTYLEINANAHRLDLSELLIREAAAAGASFVINPDAHATRGLADTALGVAIARRAGLTSERVFNARGPREMREALATRRGRGLERLAVMRTETERPHA